MKFGAVGWALLLALSPLVLAQDGTKAPGTDIAAVFARAKEGAPLRVVALGGSITQGGEGWIGNWLRQTFPRSVIYLQNAGVGGTGSDLGRARLERDVLAYDPDLVLIEFCVNDSARSDAEVIGDLEAIVIRLKSLPRPPAILFVIAAQQTELNKERHRRVAAHYGLLEVDVDQAMHAHLEQSQKPWSELMEDAVHPNAKGHAFYESVITERLQKLPTAASSYQLPPALSSSLPSLKVRMIPLRSAAPGWEIADVPPGKKNRGFLGLITASEPGTTLSFPFRGTEVGLMYLNHPDFGSFYASVDGAPPRQIYTNLYEGYGFINLARGLPPGEHRLEIALPPAQTSTGPWKVNGPVKLGYVLVGEGDGNTVSPPQIYSAEVLKNLQFVPVPAGSVAWIGPFGKAGNKSTNANLTKLYPPEAPAIQGKFTGSFPGMGEAPVEWETFPGPALDLQTKEKPESSAIYYLATQLGSASAGEALLRLEGTGTFQAWLNGIEILPIAKPRGDAPFILPLLLKAGSNSLLIKAGSAQGECRLSLALAAAKIPLPSATTPVSRP